MRSASRELIAEVGSRSDHFPAYTISGALGTISVCRGLTTNPRETPRLLVAPAFPKKENDFDVFMRAGITPKAQLTGIDSDPFSGIGTSHCAIWFDDATRAEHSLEQDLSAPVARLGRKIEQKLVQARSATGDSRIIVVESWITAQLGRAPTEVVTRLRRKILDAHSNVSALLLVLRGWNATLNRHCYDIKPMLSASARPELLSALAILES